MSAATRPAVGHVVLPYLFHTGSWIHRPLVRLERVRPVVLTHRTENLDQFPFPAVHAASTLGSARKLWLALRARGRARILDEYFADVIRRESILLLHAHFGTCGWERLALAARMGIPIVTSFYGVDVSGTPRDPTWRERYRQLFENGDRFLVEGPFMADALVALGAPRERVMVWRHGIALVPPPAREEHGPLRVLVAGTFREKKGIPDALAAVARCRESGVAIRVTVIGDRGRRAGDDEEKARVLAAIERLGDAVEWLGSVSHREFLAAGATHDVFLAPSRAAADGDTEGGAPVAILEAQALGMAIVATTHADIPNVVDREEGAFLAPPGDVAALASHLQSLAADRDRVRRMGRAGRRFVAEHHDIETQVRRLEEIYLDLLDGR